MWLSAICTLFFSLLNGNHTIAAHFTVVLNILYIIYLFILTMCCNQMCSVELYNHTTVIFKVYSDMTRNLNRPIISLFLSDNLFSITAGDPGRLRHRDCWQATIISAMSLKVTSSGTSVCNDGKSYRGWPEQS